ncbi:MAG: radical SAM protein [Candidatus Omnitrophota bacterium]|nr:radical SAM protein [Candidatus Omnitrophota bacterium]
MFLPQISNFLFYRHVFSLRNIFKGSLSYIFYILGIDKICFNPITIHFLITFSCNFNCSMCSLAASKNIACKILTPQDIEKFLLAQKKFKPFIFFCGGEPFMRSDFVEVLKVVKKYNFKCGINSNGYMLDGDKIKEITGLGVELIIFSLHGQEAVHDAITGVKGSYSKSLENISLFCKNKSKRSRVIISCTINKTNIDSLEEIPLIAKRLGVDAVKFEHLNFLSSLEAEAARKYFSGDSHSLNALITDFYDNNGEFAHKLINTLTKIKKKHKGFVFVKPDLTNEEIKNWYSNSFNSKRKCFFIWHSIFIRPDGIVVPCQFLKDYELGDISKNGLRHIFVNDKSTYLRKILRNQLLPECPRCCKL